MSRTQTPTKIKLKFSVQQTKALDILEDSTTEELLYGGAAGGGKSFLGCYWQLYRRTTYPNTTGVMARSVLKDLKLSTLETFWIVAEKYFNLTKLNGLKYNEPLGTIRFNNGSVIYLKDLFLYPRDKNFKRLGSLGVTDVFIDEANEITEKAFNIINSRIRHNLINGVPKMLLTANPDHNWLKFKFVLDEKNNPVKLRDDQIFIPAKVTDNPDKAFAKIYTKQLKKLPTYDRQRLLGGDWAVIQNERPFFYEFNRTKHIAPQQFHLDQYENVWESFDFNIDPATCIVGQKIDGVGLFFYAVHQKKGGTRVLCQDLLQYNDYMLRVTGDNSGHSGSSAAGVLAGGQYNTDYGIIKEKQHLTNKQLYQTHKANRRHTYSRTLCNTVLFRVPIFINPTGCEMLISDLETAQPTSQGKLLKDRDQHKQDVGDAFRYMINAWFPKGIKDVNKFCNLLTD